MDANQKREENSGLLNYLKIMITRNYTDRQRARGVIIGVVGSTILVIGVVMMVLPGPAFIVIPIGLGILATEFAWAKRLLRKVEGKILGQMGIENFKIHGVKMILVLQTFYTVYEEYGNLLDDAIADRLFGCFYTLGYFKQ